jgi:hypothetical protein
MRRGRNADSDLGGGTTGNFYFTPRCTTVTSSTRKSRKLKELERVMLQRDRERLHREAEEFHRKNKP